MNSEATVKTWEKTKLQNLVRHKSGRYYARLYRNGKEIWKSLKTSHYSVAEAKLAEELKAHRELKAKVIDPGDTKIRFSAAAAIHMERLEARTTIKRRTRDYWKEIYNAIVKSWPGLLETEVRKITPTKCGEWAARHARSTSGNCYNNAISLLRHIFGVAKELGAIYSNPAEELERVTVRGKKLNLPSLAKFAEFIAEMRRAHSRDSKNCADLAEGLAYTGMRKGEAAEVTRGDVNFATGELRILGDPEDGTKNGEVRYVPLIPQARELFARMLAERPDEDSTAKLFQVRECQKSMTRSAKKVGMARITHHDLRHFFAMACIESGVDIPTVSRWLGHKDGGALAMKVYGHLRREHSVAQAQRVSFAHVSTPVAA